MTAIARVRVGLAVVAVGLVVAALFVGREPLPVEGRAGEEAGDVTDAPGDAPDLDTRGPPAPLPPCGRGPVLDRAPVAPEALSVVVPLGHVVPPAHVFPTAQLDLYLARDADGAIRPASLVAPGALRVVTIGRKEELLADDARPRFTDYSLYTQHCAELSGYFMLVQSLSPSLGARVGRFDRSRCTTYATGGSRFRFCSKSVSIDVASGEPLGIVGRPAAGRATDGTRATAIGRRDHGMDLFDWGMRDARVAPLAFVAPSHQGDRELAQTICPLDELPPAARAPLVMKLGRPDGARSRDGACGRVDQDVADTAAGRWWKDGAPDRPEDPHLALAHDDLDARVGWFSVGTSLSPAVAPQRLAFTPRGGGGVNVDFGSLRAPGRACYEHVDGSGASPFHGALLVELPSSDRLELTALPEAVDCAHRDERGAVRAGFHR